VAEREASGDFDYLWDDPADVAGLTSDDRVPESAGAEQTEHPLKDPDDDLWDEPDDSFWDNRSDPDGYLNDGAHFDPFNMKTWGFTPPPAPWYRTKPAVTAIIAASAAMAAIVVSAVLLVVRGPASTLDGGASSVTPTAPTSAEAVEVATSAAPPPPPPAPPPPPPPPETASPVSTAPQYSPTSGPRSTKAPDTGVNLTPITRLPISVAPRARVPHPGIP
jgi:hypothetical protein